ncbi:MAG TPA: hypothetical protein VG098_03615 [Nitrososphaera sp.]|nr:hypothetical protein [Nitrososphaera sp.]
MTEWRNISRVPYRAAFVVLAVSAISSSLLIPANFLAYAHTFSSNESADFLSLVEQIRAETALVLLNLQNNNVTLAQAHVEKVPGLLTNSTLDEIWEVNTRIASGLESDLEQLERNVTSLASLTPQGQLPQDRIQSIDETVTSINDLLAEAVTVRIESEQQNNATTWALALADLVNVVLTDYGNATGATFDLTDMSNLAGLEGMEMDHGNGNNSMTMIMSDVQMQISGNSTDGNMVMADANSTTSSSMSNVTTTNIVDEAAYQSAQYISNNTISRLFTETLKPLSLSSNEASSSETGNATTADNTSVITQEGEQQQIPSGNLTSNMDELESSLMLLRDKIANKATPIEVMTTVHLQIHPLLMQMYGLTIASPEVESGHPEHPDS